MKKLNSLVTAACVALMVCCSPNLMADPVSLDSVEADSVVFFWDFSKFKRDFFLTGDYFLHEPELISLAADEQRHVDVLEGLLASYEVEKPIYYWGNLSWDFWMAAKELGISPYLMWPNVNYKLPVFFQAGAYAEEVFIREIRIALEYTDEIALIDSYTKMLAKAGTHLLYFASGLFEDPFEYTAQVVSQYDVDAILAGAGLSPGFSINSGLNDAWYEPSLDGQGFTISVYEDKGIVFLVWFTYDTDLPGLDATWNLGDPGQRWLTAQGTYEGADAELVVYSTSGGLFGESHPDPELIPIGSINLHFENCYNGVVNYDLQSIGRSGSIPIQRVATDNVCHCLDDVAITR